jgi:choice-of-anchor B domain-containing protein
MIGDIKQRRPLNSLQSLLGVFSLVIVWLLALAWPVLAHGAKTLYVATHGIDRGACDTPSAPCRTLSFAFSRAHLGDEVRVAAGAYAVEMEDLLTLGRDLVTVRAGYTSANNFSAPDPIANPTYLIGVPRSYRQLLAGTGFILARDGKEVKSDDLSGALSLPSANTSPCLGGTAGGYPCFGLDLMGRVALSDFSSNPSAANDVWGYVDLDDGREYALIGLRNGTAIVDVTDPSQPVEVGTIAGLETSWRDVKVYQFYNGTEGRWDGYAYVVADNVNQGLHIIDLSDLPASVSLASTYTGFSQAHNIYLGEVDYTTGVTLTGASAYAYILGSDKRGGAFRILDLSAPTSPLLATAPPAGAEYVHDATTVVITDTRTVACDQSHNPCHIFIDFNVSTVDLWDVTDKAAPYMISSTGYEDVGYTHSGWWSTDKMYIFIQDELDEEPSKTRLRTLDISDLTAPFVSNVWLGPTKAIDHNGFSKGTRYYMSNYRRGLTVLDVSNPNAPWEVAYFDTYPPNDKYGFYGAWGVYPYLPSGTILVSDIYGGLFLLREQPTLRTYLPLVLK